MEDLKKLKVKNWKETAKDRRTWRDLAEKAKTHKGLYCQMMMMMMMMMMLMYQFHAATCSSMLEALVLVVVLFLSS